MPQAQLVSGTGVHVWPTWTQTYSTTSTLWAEWNVPFNVRWANGTTTAATVPQNVWREWTTTNSITLTQLTAAWTTWTETASTGLRQVQEAMQGVQAAMQGVQLRQPLQRHLRQEGVALVRTDEQWAAIRREAEEARARRDTLQTAARAEARKLLELVLNRGQLASYDEHRFFDVVGSHGTLYRVRHGVSGNISQIVDGKEVSVLCVHPSMLDLDRGGHLPTEDSLVAQVLALKHNELDVVQTANVHAGRRHLAAVAA